MFSTVLYDFTEVSHHLFILDFLIISFSYSNYHQTRPHFCYFHCMWTCGLLRTENTCASFRMLCLWFFLPEYIDLSDYLSWLRKALHWYKIHPEHTAKQKDKFQLQHILHQFFLPITIWQSRCFRSVFFSWWVNCIWVTKHNTNKARDTRDKNVSVFYESQTFFIFCGYLWGQDPSKAKHGLSWTKWLVQDTTHTSVKSANFIHVSNMSRQQSSSSEMTNKCKCHTW